MIRIGIICPSEIAFRRFMPAVKRADGIQYVGVGVADVQEWFGAAVTDVTNKQKEALIEGELKKAQAFVDQYGGRIFHSYAELIGSNDVDAVYLPLPPALHYQWGKRSLENGKHIYLEKPSTSCSSETKDLIEIASKSNLVVHENYMFVFHTQIEELNRVIDSGEIGDIRLIRLSFGFPLRSPKDFRYNKTLGGGALLDAGGYTIKYGSMLLGDTARLTTAQANYVDGYEVEMYGTATMVNDCGKTVQMAFGMDNDYRCEVEIWGSRGTITSGRIFTAPADFVPSYVITKNQETETRLLSHDNTFLKSINHFVACCQSASRRIENYRQIFRQSMYIDDFRSLCGLDI